jgi:hypothetical protein
MINYQTSQKIKFLGQCDFFSSSYEPYSWYLSTVSTEKSVRSAIEALVSQQIMIFGQNPFRPLQG